MKNVFAIIFVFFLIFPTFSENILQKNIIAGNIVYVKNIIKNNKELVNYRLNSVGETPLTIACQNARYDIVVYLINNGANVNEKDYDGMTPLLHSLSFYQSNFESRKKIFKTLIENNAYINAQNKSGWSALMLIASIGDLDLALYSINHNAIIKLENFNGDNAITIASNKKHEELYDFLQRNTK